MEPCDLGLTSPETFRLGPPHELFARLRQEAPVILHRRDGLPPFWVVTRHRDVVAASRDPATFSSQRHGVFLDESSADARRDGHQTMVNLDPPAHTRLRRLVAPQFTPAAVDKLTSQIRSQCTVALDRFCERGDCDFARDVAAEFSVAVLCALLGAPDAEERQRVRMITSALGDPLGQASPDVVARATAQAFEYAAELAQWRRRSPGDDLVSVLLRPGPDGERLSHGEYELLILLLLTAGHLTTQHLISGAMLAFFEHPAQWHSLVVAGALPDAGVDEMLRWVSPVMQFQRTATRDTVLGGQAITAGDRVALYYLSANRDEDVFDDPGRFDLTRAPGEQVSFGAGGPHFCLGSSLARRQVRTVFEELARRMPDIELAGAPLYLESTFLNGVSLLPVRFSPSAPVRLPGRGR
ncbi:MAG TPA: cytochrome P450 [Streptosporangiaceae bacterium]|nr:cytochrome P450 [Streptosporangiaceae bacterium]